LPWPSGPSSSSSSLPSSPTTSRCIRGHGEDQGHALLGVVRHARSGDSHRWCFGNFLEGMAGFGTAVAIPASMLAALGVNPVTAILACLLANGLPTMFGSIGIPTATLATITGIDPISLAFTQALQAFPFVLVTPLLMVGILGGKKAMKGMVPVALIAGISFGLPEIAAARFIGTDLPDIVGRRMCAGHYRRILPAPTRAPRCLTSIASKSRARTNASPSATPSTAWLPLHPDIRGAPCHEQDCALHP